MTRAPYRGFRFPGPIIQHAVWLYARFTLSLRGRPMYLWRAVDAEGEILEVLVQSKRDRHAALRLMRKLLKKHGVAPAILVTDRLGAYSAAVRELGLSSAHVRGKRKNNRAESSHVPIRQRERKMQGFRSAGSAQRFLAIHAAVANTFTTCRHLVSAKTHRLLRNQAFLAWQQAASLTT
jgi:putative transposase